MASEQGDLEYVMLRLDVWKAAVAGMREMSMAPTPVDALYLAEFLAGDRLPSQNDGYGAVVMEADSDTDEAPDA